MDMNTAICGPYINLNTQQTSQWPVFKIESRISFIKLPWLHFLRVSLFACKSLVKLALVANDSCEMRYSNVGIQLAQENHKVKILSKLWLNQIHARVVFVTAKFSTGCFYSEMYFCFLRSGQSKFWCFYLYNLVIIQSNDN